MFQFGYARVVKERPGASYAETSCRNQKRGGAEWKLYLAVLLHVLVRFTAELVPLTTPQGSKRRSDSFFDEGMIVEAGRVRSKRGHWSSRTG